MAELFCAAHERLVARVAEHVTDVRVLHAVRAVPRSLFTPDDLRSGAHDEQPLEIGRGLVLPAPLVVARMCEALELRGSERVLDVGPGLGYRAAVVAGVCAEVVAIVPSSALVERAQLALRRAGVTNVRVVTGEVAARHAPYDAVILATPGPASDLESLLADGGRLLAPDASGEQLLVSDPRDGGRPVQCMPLLPAAPIG